MTVAVLGEFLVEQSHYCLGRKRAVTILEKVMPESAERA
jgi:hypothetical protein